MTILRNPNNIVTCQCCKNKTIVWEIKMSSLPIWNKRK